LNTYLSGGVVNRRRAGSVHLLRGEVHSKVDYAVSIYVLHLAGLERVGELPVRKRVGTTAKACSSLGSGLVFSSPHSEQSDNSGDPIENISKDRAERAVV